MTLLSFTFYIIDDGSQYLKTPKLKSIISSYFKTYFHYLHSEHAHNYSNSTQQHHLLNATHYLSPVHKDTIAHFQYSG